MMRGMVVCVVFIVVPPLDAPARRLRPSGLPVRPWRGRIVARHAEISDSNSYLRYRNLRIRRRAGSPCIRPEGPGLTPTSMISRHLVVHGGSGVNAERRRHLRAIRV